MKSFSSTHTYVVIGLALGLGGLVLVAQDQDKASSSSTSNTETNAKPLTKKEIARKQKALEKELAGPWKKWLDEDVRYIITDEERQ
jgi:hypothetical protein